MSQNKIISWSHSMRAMKIHLRIHWEGWKSCCQRTYSEKKDTGRLLAQCCACEPCCLERSHNARLQPQAQVGPSLAPWWHTWAPPKALVLLLSFSSPALWGSSLWAGLWWLLAAAGHFRQTFYFPQCFWPCPILDMAINDVPSSCLVTAFALFSLPLPQTPKWLAYVFHLSGSMGMQWAQKLISSWWVLNLTSWCSHAFNVNKACAL